MFGAPIYQQIEYNNQIFIILRPPAIFWDPRRFNMSTNNIPYMTRKHFVMLAEELAQDKIYYKSIISYNEKLNRLCSYCANANPKFDKTRFIAFIDNQRSSRSVPFQSQTICLIFIIYMLYKNVKAIIPMVFIVRIIPVNFTGI